VRKTRKKTQNESSRTQIPIWDSLCSISLARATFENDIEIRKSLVFGGKQSALASVNDTPAIFSSPIPYHPSSFIAYFIITGSPHALYGLVTNLCKIRVQNGSNESKVEFSKQKLVFGMHFLIVGVPFHSQYLQDATDKAIYQDLSGEELWIAEGLQIPVYHTENGG